jgi:hypothetical protein
MEVEKSRNEEENCDRLTIRFDGPEGRGTIVLEDGPYGLWVICPDVDVAPLGLLDLFYQGDEMRGKPPANRPVIQFVFHSPAETEDPMGRIRWFPDGVTPARTYVDFESNVVVVRAPWSSDGVAYALGG